MSSYPFLFEVEDKADPGEQIVALPLASRPAGKIVVATQEPLDMATYLQRLDHTYPVLEAKQNDATLKT